MRDYPVTVAIIGSTKFNDYAYLESRTGYVLGSVWDRLVVQDVKPIFKIISGGATGADSLGEAFAKKHDYEFKPYLPAFKEFGGPYRKRDYYDRDVKIAEACHILIGFLVKMIGENKGSKLTIEAALDRHKEVHVFFK